MNEEQDGVIIAVGMVLFIGIFGISVAIAQGPSTVTMAEVGQGIVNFLAVGL